MAECSDREVITEKQENDFFEATMNMVTWENAVVLMKGGESTYIKDITYEDAMYLLTTEDYICIPF